MPRSGGNVALDDVYVGGDFTVVFGGATERPAPLTPQDRAGYLAAVTARYRVLDLSALTPESEDEHLPVLLRQVFVPQTVRADPAPVELPRDLWRRLVETGDVGSAELPDEMEHLDRELLARARASHTAQVPRAITQLLSDPAQRLVALLGDPGAGKSSLLRYLALALSGEQVPDELSGLAGWLPVIVELRSYAGPGWRVGRWADGTLLDFLDHQHANEGLGLPRQVLEQYLSSDGRAVVMFDGLDELFDAAQREETAQRIAAFSRRFPRVRVVVTSRVIGYRRGVLDGAGFRLHQLEDLDAEQIGTFIDQWYRLASRGNQVEADSRSARLRTSIDRSPSAADLAGNPMLLTILAVIGRRRELPKERHRVYRHAVEVLTQHWDLNRAVRDTRVAMDYIDEEDKRELLRRIARRMQEGRGGIAGNHIHRDDLLAEFRDYLQERYQQPLDQAKIVAKAMLEQFRDRNFILSRFGPGTYGFVHRAFLEYCCADEIVYRFKESRDLPTEELVTVVFGGHAGDPAWQEVLLLIAGMIHERFLAKIIDHLLELGNAPGVRVDPDTVGRHWILAARCLAEARSAAMLQAQSERIVDGLIENLTVIRTTIVTRRTWNTLGLHYALRAVVIVVQDIGPQLPARNRYLDWFRGCPVPPETYDNAERWRFARTTTEIACALFPGDPDLRALLVGRIDDPDVHVREAAIDELTAGWADESTRTLLMERASRDVRPDVGAASVEALAGRWPDARTRAVVTRCFATGHDGRVRRAAIHAMVSAWPDARTRALLHTSAGSDPDWAIRQLALAQLAAGWPDAETRDVLVRSATTDHDDDVRKAAAEELAQRWPDHRTRDLLVVRATADPHELVRAAAVAALGTGWSHDGCRDLIGSRAATDIHEDVRKGAVEVVARVWPDDRTRALLLSRATADPHWSVRLAAVDAVVQTWPDATTHQFLLAGMRSEPDEMVRRTIVLALAGGWPDDRTRALVTASLSADPDAEVRASAVEVLAAAWPDADSWARIASASTRDEDWSVRSAALVALGRHWPDDRTRAHLTARATTDRDEVVRAEALDELVLRWPDERTRALLVTRARADADEYDRRCAMDGLMRGWRDEQTRALLTTCAAEDPDENNRSAALVVVVGSWPDDRSRALAQDRSRADSDPTVRRAAAEALAHAWPDEPTRSDVADLVRGPRRVRSVGRVGHRGPDLARRANARHGHVPGDRRPGRRGPADRARRPHPAPAGRRDVRGAP